MTNPFVLQPRPDGADIEILEVHGAYTTEGAEVVLPNEVRINGTRILVPEGRHVVVDPIGLTEDGTTVTITMYVRSLSIRAEPGPKS